MDARPRKNPSIARDSQNLSGAVGGDLSRTSRTFDKSPFAPSQHRFGSICCKLSGTSKSFCSVLRDKKYLTFSLEGVSDKLILFLSSRFHKVEDILNHNI